MLYEHLELLNAWIQVQRSWIWLLAYNPLLQVLTCCLSLPHIRVSSLWIKVTRDKTKKKEKESLNNRKKKTLLSHACQPDTQAF